jgi:hypothetical protein
VTPAARRLAALVAVLAPDRCAALSRKLGGAFAAAAAEADRLTRLSRAERLHALALALSDGAPPATELAASLPAHPLIERLVREAQRAS